VQPRPRSQSVERNLVPRAVSLTAEVSFVLPAAPLLSDVASPLHVEVNGEIPHEFEIGFFRLSVNAHILWLFSSSNHNRLTSWTSCLLSPPAGHSFSFLHLFPGLPLEEISIQARETRSVPFLVRVHFPSFFDQFSPSEFPGGFRAPDRHPTVRSLLQTLCRFAFIFS